MQAVGDDLVDSIVGDNIPILTEAEKFNETVISSVKRVSARLLGARCAATWVLRAPPANHCLLACMEHKGLLHAHSNVDSLLDCCLPWHGALALAATHRYLPSCQGCPGGAVWWWVDHLLLR